MIESRAGTWRIPALLHFITQSPQGLHLPFIFGWYMHFMTKCDFVYFDAGGGHRSAANSLSDVIGQVNLPWEIRMVNLQEVLDPLDVVRKLTGYNMQDVYNHILKRQWTLAAPPLNRALHAVIRFSHKKQVDLLEAYWTFNRPDLVVSLIPHFNRALLESLRRFSQSVPFVTIMTDIADYPPHFWIEPQRQHLICASRRAVEQALALGFQEELIHQTSGMIIHPRFYRSLTVDREQELQALGLYPELRTGLVMFGGHGSQAMIEIAESLEAMSSRVQLILICGHNAKLVETLRSKQGLLKKHIVGFTTEIPRYMRLCDFFIGKPGPGSISEALAMHLPVILERNVSTLPQERYNTQWVEEMQVGIVVSSFKSITGAVRRILRPEVLSVFRAHAAALKNRAVFEIPPILLQILHGTSRRRSASA